MKERWRQKTIQRDEFETGGDVEEEMEGQSGRFLLSARGVGGEAGLDWLGQD